MLTRLLLTHSCNAIMHECTSTVPGDGFFRLDGGSCVAKLVKLIPTRLSSAISFLESC